MQMDRAVIRELMDDPQFHDRIAAVAIADGAAPSEAEATAASARLQVATTPNVYAAYFDAWQVSDISDAAILEGLRRDAFQDYPVPDLIGE